MIRGQRGSFTKIRGEGWCILLILDISTVDIKSRRFCAQFIIFWQLSNLQEGHLAIATNRKAQKTPK